jgi:hypothetical protein
MSRHDKSRKNLQQAVANFGRSAAQRVKADVAHARKSSESAFNDEGAEAESMVKKSPEGTGDWQGAVNEAFSQMKVFFLEELGHLRREGNERAEAQKEHNEKTDLKFDEISRRQTAFDERQTAADRRQTAGDERQTAADKSVTFFKKFLEHPWRNTFFVTLVTGSIIAIVVLPSWEFLIKEIIKMSGFASSTAANSSAAPFDKIERTSVGASDKNMVAVGNDKPSCWNDARGHVVPVFAIRILDDGYIISENWVPNFAAKGKRTKSIMDLLNARDKGGHLGVRRFIHYADRIKTFGALETTSKTPCVYYADTKNETNTNLTFSMNKRYVARYFKLNKTE